MTTPSGPGGFDNQPARFGISPNPLSSDTPAALVGRTQEAIEAKLKAQYVSGGPSIWALNPGSPLTIANNVLNAVFKAILGALDPHNLPTPEQVWQQITDVFLAPLNWLHNIPIGAITGAAPNILADFITAESLVGETMWVFDDAVEPAGAVGSVRLTFDGTVHELISERVVLDVGRKVDASVKVKYSGVTAPTGSPIRLSWIGWNGEAEVAGGDFAVHQPSGSTLDWTTLSGSLTRLGSDPWDRVSIVLKTTAGATGGTVWFGAPRATKPDLLPQNLVDGLVDALADLLGRLGDLLNKLLHAPADVLGDISGVVASAAAGTQHTLQNIWDAIASGLGGASSGNSAASINTQAVAVAQAAQDAAAAAYAAQLAVQRLENPGGGVGVTFDMDITGADGDPLPAGDWTNVSNLAVRVKGSTAAMGITAGTAAGVVSAADCVHTYTTDSQALAVVLGAGGDSVAATVLHFHCNAAKTRGLYASILTTGVTVGYFTGALGARTYTPFPGGAVSASLATGARVEIRNGATANTYELLINGTKQPLITDAGAHAVAGDMSAHITQTSRNQVFNPGLPWSETVRRESFRLPSILMSDYAVPTYVGSLACIYRTATATVSLGSNGSNNILGSSFFGVIDKATDDITVDLANSKFTVSVEGMYEIGIRSVIDMGSGTAAAQTITPLLYVNGAISKWGSESFRYWLLGNNGTAYAGDMESMQSTFRVYLRAGDYVQPGWHNRNVGSGTLTGEATGTKTYFDITRIGSKS